MLKAADRFETLTLVLGYCGLRFGEAVALRRRHVGDRVLTVRSSATAVTGVVGHVIPQGLLSRNSPGVGLVLVLPVGAGVV